MNKISTSVLLLGISLMMTTSAFCQSSAEESTPKNTIQDTEKAAQFFEDELNFKTNAGGVKAVVNGKVQNVTIVDVRLEKNFAERHIPGAINLPFDKYSSFEGAETEFPGLRKDGFNYIYCYETACNLSQKAAKKFASLGYPVKEVVGGFESWKEHKYPVQK